MEVKIKRFEHDNVQGTRGIVMLNDKFIGYSIECPKLYNTPYLSRIPAGTYLAMYKPSKKYGTAFIIENVPCRFGIILFHKGNTKEDFQGCIGLGDSMFLMDEHNAVGNTKAMCAKFYKDMKDVDQLTVIIEDV